jgi:phosphoglycolate phosphatase-like HAD superfamily hydrolase
VTLDLVKEAKTIFWDFDGVIKDSVPIKSEAFEKLFQPFGDEISRKVKKHHEENGGMSRFEKLPIYLEWAGKNSSTNLVLEYEKKFSKIVMQKVIESPWVAGVLNYLEKNAKKQQFFIVTATPHAEIIKILKELEIINLFKHIVGSPTSKKTAINQLLIKYKIKLDYALMIGDSNSDYEAAIENKVKFVLRKTELNKKLQKKLKCKKINDFLDG